MVAVCRGADDLCGYGQALDIWSGDLDQHDLSTKGSSRVKCHFNVLARGVNLDMRIELLDFVYASFIKAQEAVAVMVNLSPCALA